MTIGERIKELRREREMTQIQLADKCGFTRQTMANYENNRNEPCLLNATCIADVLDVSLDELVGRERR